MPKRNKTSLLAQNHLAGQILQNVLLERKLWLQRMLDPRRNVEYECGHPEVVTCEDYRHLFLRGDIAARVVSVWPEESWAERPIIFETEEDTETEFEKAWNALEKRLRILSTLLRADILSGIGRFGVILLGLNDGKPLSEPAAGVNERGEPEGAPKHDLLYLRPLDEGLVTISKLQTDPTNPRYGQPVLYDLRFEDQGDLKIQSGQVHWSRIIHLADNRTSSDIYGVPRMEKVVNRLLDIKKIAGGSGEMFWKGGFPGISMEAMPNADEVVDFDTKDLKDQLEAYMNGLQRYLATVGMTSKQLTVQVADPGPHLEVQLRLISVAIGVPWRIFLGSEAAQLASVQDMRAWNRRLHRRREDYLPPYVISPLLDRLINLGVLPRPSQYIIHWPDLNSLSDADKADVAAKKTEALAKYVQGGCDVLMSPFFFLTLFLGLSDAEARAIINDSLGNQRDEDSDLGDDSSNA